jgi:hypothetical protein
MLEKVFAALTLVVCLALLLHMAIGPVRRENLRLRWRALRDRGGLGQWRDRWASRQRRSAARREAELVIERARQAAEKGEWDGNVYRPKSFDRRPEKRPPPH